MNKSDNSNGIRDAFDFLDSLPKYLTKAEVLAKMKEQPLCMVHQWERSVHDYGAFCACHRSPNYEYTLGLLAGGRAARNRNGDLGDLYDRIEKWQRDFYGRAAAGDQTPDYYRDAASGLAIALQEIHRERYDETSGAIWQEYQALLKR